MADVVEKEDINEALRLMEMSKQSLYEEESGSQYVNINICCLKKFIIIGEIIVNTTVNLNPHKLF